MSQKIRIKPLIFGVLFTIAFWKVLSVITYNSHSEIKHYTYPFNYFTVNISAHGSQKDIDAVLVDLPQWLAEFQAKYRHGGAMDSVIYHAKAYDTIPLDSLAYAMFDFALFFRELSEGKIDVSIGNLLRAWKNAWQNNQSLADSTRERLVAEKKAPIYQLESDSQSMKIQREKQHFAMGAYMEGIILDEIDNRLAKAQIPGWLAEVSGDFSYSGVKADGKPWVLGIKNPEQPKNLLAKVAMDPQKISFCTSGDYEQTHSTPDGKRHHHIMDPRTGESSIGNRSVSVMQSIPGMNKNTLCTWFMLLPLDEIKAKTQEFDGKIAALVILASNDIWVSPGLEQFIEFFPYDYKLLD